MSSERIVFFDGNCNLCNRSVDFLLRHDRAQRLRFAPLQSEIASTLLARAGAEAATLGAAANPSHRDAERDPSTFVLAAGHGDSSTTILPDRAGDPATIAFSDGDRLHLKSSAALRLFGVLGWPWRIFTVFLFVPKPLRDLVYDWIARNRYRWFGRRDTCRLPSPGERARFLA